MNANIEIEKQIDVQLSEVTRLDGELHRVSDTIAQLLEETRAADVALEKLSAVQAGIELAARLDGSKASKPTPEIEAARSQSARLTGMHRAAVAMLAELESARAAAIVEAERLVREVARLEFVECEKLLASAWTAFAETYARFSGAAYCADIKRGWNGPVMMDGLRIEACAGVRVQQADIDTAAFVRAISESHAGHLRLKLDGIINR